MQPTKRSKTTLHTYLFTYSMEQSPSWEANRFPVGQEIPAFYGTRRFITAFTSACHLSLSWASSIQSIHPHPTSWRSILILSSHLRLGLPSDLSQSGFPTKTLYTPLLSPIQRPSTKWNSQERTTQQRSELTQPVELPSAALTYPSTALQRDLWQIVRVGNARYCENMCQFHRWPRYNTATCGRTLHKVGFVFASLCCHIVCLNLIAIFAKGWIGRKCF